MRILCCSKKDGGTYVLLCLSVDLTLTYFRHKDIQLVICNAVQ